LDVAQRVGGARLVERRPGERGKGAEVRTLKRSQRHGDGRGGRRHGHVVVGPGDSGGGAVRLALDLDEQRRARGSRHGEGQSGVALARGVLAGEVLVEVGAGLGVEREGGPRSAYACHRFVVWLEEVPGRSADSCSEGVVVVGEPRLGINFSW